MAFYSGSQGQLLIDGVAAARVQGWSVSTSLGLLDTTSLEDTDRTSTPGVRSTTGSCTLFYYAPDPGEPGRNDASVLINKLTKSSLAGQRPGQANESEAVTLRLRVVDGSTTGKFLEVNAHLTSVEMRMAVGEVLSAQVAWEANGAPTEVNL
jgi:hypothetical protein